MAHGWIIRASYNAEKDSATQGDSSSQNVTERTCLHMRVRGKSAALCGGV